MGVRTGPRGEEGPPKVGAGEVGAAVDALTPEPAEGAARRAPCARAPPNGASRVGHGFHFLPSVQNPSIKLSLPSPRHCWVEIAFGEDTVPIFQLWTGDPAKSRSYTRVARARFPPIHLFTQRLLRSPHPVLGAGDMAEPKTDRSLASWGFWFRWGDRQHTNK